MEMTSHDSKELSGEAKRSLLAELLRKKIRGNSTFPLSFAQQSIWFLDQLQPGTALFNVPGAIRLRGRRWHAAEGERALNEVIRRHHILRTTFDQQGGRPVQILRPLEPCRLAVIDLSGLPPEQRDAEAARLLRENAVAPFDLKNGPLLRCRMVLLGPEDQIILFAMHHIIGDGLSVAILLRELVLHYMAFRQGLEMLLPDLSAQYFDYVRWERDNLEGKKLEKQCAFWKERLLHTPRTVDLPTDRPRPSVVRFRGAREKVHIPGDLTRAARKTAGLHHATPFMVFLAAFLALLHRYSRQETICVGSPVTGRRRQEFEHLIGCFADPLVLCGHFQGDPTFAELLGRVRLDFLTAMEHQDLPFQRVVDELQLPRDTSRSPVFQVMFAYSTNLTTKPQAHLEKLFPGGELSGMDWELLETDTGMSMFDLTLWMAEGVDGLWGTIEYGTDLFDAATIRRMLQHYERLLAAALADPNKRISELPLLTEPERRQLLAQGRQAVSEPQGTFACAQHMFEDQAARAPDAIALEFGAEQMSYGELNRRANQLAHELRGRGVGPETLVAIGLARSPEAVVAILATLKAGGGYLPLDPDSPAERLAFMLDDSRAGFLVTAESLAPQFSHFSGTKVSVDAVRAELQRQPDTNPIGVTAAGNLAYAIYTSGSTGRPKAAVLEHRGLVNLVEAQRAAFHVTPRSRVLQFASLSFDASVSEIFVTLCSGATLCLPERGRLSDPAELPRLLERERISLVTLPPPLLASLPETRLPALETLVVAGEACRTDIVERWGRGRRFLNAYGPTEATVCATIAECRPESAGKSDLPHQPPPPIGRPIRGVEVYVLDAQQQMTPVGVPGELYIGGRGVGRGYLNRPELTAERFVPNPFAANDPEAVMYRTGDRARWLPDGNLEFLGRVDQQVKVRGYRIEPGEVEGVLRQCPSLRETIVVARVHQEHNHLIAYCVPTGDPPPVEELRSFLAEHLPDYMIPSGFEFLDALPRLPSGKIDYQRLPEPQRDRPRQAVEHVAPRDELEARLVKIWQSVLNLDRIGIGDNFFALGGHSLAAVMMKFRLQEELGLNVPLTTLFQAPTVERLAATLRHGASGKEGAVLIPLHPSGTRRPLFFVHPSAGSVLCYLELSRRLGEDQPFFGLQSVGLDGAEPPLTTVEAMAARYVEDLCQAHKEGPLVLGGWSMGGVVALEMAQQLRARGREVPLLVLLDAPLLGSDNAEQGQDEGARRAYALRELAHQLGGAVDLESLPWQGLPTEAQLREYLQAAGAASLVPVEAGLAEMKHRLAVLQGNLAAHRNYRPQPYSGDVVLFRARDQLPGVLPSTEDRWRNVVGGRLDVHEAPGNHYTLLQSLQIEVIAQRLAGILAQREARGS